ncbi:MAG: hypothetical protein ABSC37_20370, partial [Xanthobacteraceae bacterium]
APRKGIVMARQTFPGCGAARSGAPLFRDRRKLSVWNDPGSAAHHFALARYVLRCARDTYPKT